MKHVEPVPQAPVHTGAERFELVLTYTTQDIYVIDRMAYPGEIVADTVVLVWVRNVGEPWRRYTQGRHGSRIEGYPKLEYLPDAGMRGVRRSQEIFRRGTVPEILPLALRLPGLRRAIEQAEDELPHPAIEPWKSGLTG